jgi:predicted nucleotidyltransferase
MSQTYPSTTIKKFLKNKKQNKTKTYLYAASKRLCTYKHTQTEKRVAKDFACR